MFIVNNNLIKNITYLNFNAVDTIIQTNKRTMMAASTRLTGTESLQQKKLYSLLFKQLREGPLTQEKLLSLVEMSPINVKLFQDMVSKVFPNAEFPLSLIQQRYPGIKIGLVNSDFMSWNDVIAIHIASIANKHGIFPKEGKLYVLGTPPYDPFKGDTSNNAQAIANTGQKNPDYYFVHKDWTRYYDYKSGQYSPMKGHIVLKNNKEDFEKEVQLLIIHQRNFFRQFGTEYNAVIAFIDKVLNDKNLAWSQKSKSLSDFYFNNMHKLPVQTPSIILQQDPSYEHVHMSHKQFGNIPVKSESCQSVDGTYDIMTKVFLQDKSGKLFDNYQRSHGFSAIFIKLKKKVILEVLGEFFS